MTLDVSSNFDVNVKVRVKVKVCLRRCHQTKVSYRQLFGVGDQILSLECERKLSLPGRLLVSRLASHLLTKSDNTLYFSLDDILVESNVTLESVTFPASRRSGPDTIPNTATRRTHPSRCLCVQNTCRIV